MWSDAELMGDSLIIGKQYGSNTVWASRSLEWLALLLMGSFSLI